MWAQGGWGKWPKAFLDQRRTPRCTLYLLAEPEAPPLKTHFPERLHCTYGCQFHIHSSGVQTFLKSRFLIRIEHSSRAEGLRKGGYSSWLRLAVNGQLVPPLTCSWCRLSRLRALSCRIGALSPPPHGTSGSLWGAIRWLFGADALLTMLLARSKRGIRPFPSTRYLCWLQTLQSIFRCKTRGGS